MPSSPRSCAEDGREDASSLPFGGRTDKWNDGEEIRERGRTSLVKFVRQRALERDETSRRLRDNRNASRRVVGRVSAMRSVRSERSGQATGADVFYQVHCDVEESLRGVQRSVVSGPHSNRSAIRAVSTRYSFQASHAMLERRLPHVKRRWCQRLCASCGAWSSC